MAESQIVPRTPLEAQLRDPGRQQQIMRSMPFDDPKTRHALMQQFIDLARNPPKELAKASPASVFECVLGAARLGLQLNGPLHQAYAIAHGNNATLIVGYRGIVKLMRAGGVKEIHTGLIYENDDYEWTESSFTMKRRLGGDRGEIVGAFCKLVMDDGSHQTEVMNRDEIEHVREKSKAKGAGPWVTDWGQMARKTVLRRAANLVELKEREAGLIAQADRSEFAFEDAEVEIKTGSGKGNAALMSTIEESVIRLDAATGEVIETEVE